MKKILFLITLVTTTAFAQNLVLNGSAENSPITNDWTNVSGNWTQRTSNPAPQEGAAYFFAGAGAFAELYQDIDVSSNSVAIDAGSQFYTFSCFLRSFNQAPADESKAIVTYRDAANNVLDTYDTGFSSDQVEWLSFSDARLAPVGTRTVRITLISDRNSGTNNDGYIDNVVFEQGNTLSINESIIEREAVALFPNPSNGIISFSHAADSISVYTIQGKLIFKTKNLNKNEAFNLNAKAGLYFIEVELKGKKQLIKHIIL